MIQIWFWPKGDRFNDRLAELVLEEMDRVPSSSLGVGTGWSGPKTFFELEELEALELFCVSSLPDEPWALSGWANVMCHGDRMLVHDHPISHLGGKNEWAGVYYVSAPPGSAALIFSDMGFRIEPQASMLITFPARARHEVEMHRQDALRISIAFNARHCGYPN